jgi:hypothetical protein
MHHLKTCSSVLLLLLPLADARWLEHPPRQADRRSRWRRHGPSWLVGVVGTAVFAGKFRRGLSFLQLEELNKEHAKHKHPMDAWLLTRCSGLEGRLLLL